MREDRFEEIRRLDPVDATLLVASWSASDAKPALFQEILTMPVDTLDATSVPTPVVPPRRRYRRPIAVTAALLVAAAGLVVAQGLLVEDSMAFAVRQLENGLVEVDASTQIRDGEALAAELREYGIDVEIRTVPSSPSVVGEVAVFPPGGGAYIPDGLTFGEDGTPDVFMWTIDPEQFTERITIELHVTADEGEPYLIANPVFTPGEALGGLHCALGEPLEAARVASYLGPLGLTAEWYVISATEDPSITSEQQVFEVPDGEVMWGYAQDATTLRFTVRPHHVELPDLYVPELSDVPCTSEQAARWN